MRWAKITTAVAAVIGTGTLLPSAAGAATNQLAYYITVSPTTQDPGQSVNVTGNGQYYTAPYSGDNCDSTDIFVTVTYYDITKTQKTSAPTDLGESDGDGDIGPAAVTIPAGAAPTSFTGHDAEVQAYCSYSGNTYLSQQVAVSVAGTVTTTTTTTTTTTVPSTTTTLAPSSTAPAATPVVAQPKLTG